MKQILFLSTIGLSLASLNGTCADELKLVKLDCESVESLTDRIDACSNNTLAVDSAKECYVKLINAWKSASQDLNRVMSVSKKRTNSRQDAEIAFSKTDYEKTMAKLENLIAVTKKNSDLVASYPLAMIEDPDTPVDCFTDRFQEVQDIVWKLDDRLAEGEATLEAATGLRGTATERDANMDASLTNKVLHGEGQSAPLQRVPAGQRPHQRPSDVTGIREQKVKQTKEQEILNTFPLRDQLTGP